jgi:hypothetical protein
MSISSGTIAVLTGFRWLDKVDLVQHSFVQYCLDSGATGRWQDHWLNFWVTP